MVKLEKQLAELYEQIGQVNEKINVRNSNREIECGSCEGSHKVGELKAIQHHYHISPSGCTDGDYWKQGELQYVCPETDVKNRLLFDNCDVEWSHRDEFKNNPAEQFRSMYKDLFKEVEDKYDDNIIGKWTNNHYVDSNRKKFGLVEKKIE